MKRKRTTKTMSRLNYCYFHYSPSPICYILCCCYYYCCCCYSRRWKYPQSPHPHLMHPPPSPFPRPSTRFSLSTRPGSVFSSDFASPTHPFDGHRSPARRSSCCAASPARRAPRSSPRLPFHWTHHRRPPHVPLHCLRQTWHRSLPLFRPRPGDALRCRGR